MSIDVVGGVDLQMLNSRGRPTSNISWRGPLLFESGSTPSERYIKALQCYQQGSK
jgi:hypothetical protein